MSFFERVGLVVLAALCGTALTVLILSHAEPAHASGVGGGITSVVFPDSPSLDAFARLRSSSLTPSIFDSSSQYGLLPLLWETSLTGTGTATFLANQSAVRLRVAANGDIAIRQSHRYLHYQPGKSQLVFMTATLGPITTNTTQRVGFFDANNGVFFQQNGTVLQVVQRSFVTGSPVDSPVSQASWNIDKFDGTGPSGITLDTTKSQIFVVDLQWLGVGRTRFGFSVNGRIFYAHVFNNANSLAGVYMSTATLPMRFENRATGVIGGNVDLMEFCGSVISEGGVEDERGLPFTASNGVTSISVTTRAPVLSIRPKLLFQTITNRAYINPVSYQVIAPSGAGLLVELVYQGTLTGPSFTSVSTSSTVEFDVTASAIAGGTVLDSFYVQGNTNQSHSAPVASKLLSKITIGLDISAVVQDNLSIVCTSLTGTTTANAEIGWIEIY
jgi:hypothetical protein